jgi:hypothetical protein
VRENGEAINPTKLTHISMRRQAFIIEGLGIIPGNRGTVRSIERIWLLMKRELGALCGGCPLRLNAERHISPSVPGLVTQP